MITININQPLCNLKSCRYCFDGNCIDKEKYARCEYPFYAGIPAMIEEQIKKYDQQVSYYNDAGWYAMGAKDALEDLLDKINS